MLTTSRELREIVEAVSDVRGSEARLVNVGRTLEAMILNRLVTRLRSNECRGMNRAQIIDWLEALPHDRRIFRRAPSLQQTLALYTTASAADNL